MRRAHSRATIAQAGMLLASLGLLMPLMGPFDAGAENTATAAITPQESGDRARGIPERFIIGWLVSVEGSIEFSDHPQGRQGVTKDETYIIQQDSGDQVRVVLQDDTLVEPRVDVGDRVLTFFDAHGNPTTIWEVY